MNMTPTFPALMHFAVMWRGKLLLVLLDAGRGQMYWDLPYGTCFQKPTERFVEMIIGTIITRVVVESVEEIDITANPEAIKVFIDGGIYRCTVPDIRNFDSGRARFVADLASAPEPISTRAQIALSLCMQSRP